MQMTHCTFKCLLDGRYILNHSYYVPFRFSAKFENFQALNLDINATFFGWLTVYSLC